MSDDVLPIPVLMAILPRDAAEAGLFLEEIGHIPLFERALRLMANIRGCRAMLATNLPQAAALCAELGIERIDLDGWEQDSPPYHEFLAACLEKRGSSAQAAMIVDPRYCFLGPELLERALARFRQSGATVLASAGPTQDNPAQVMLGLKILHTGQITFMEDRESSDFAWLKQFNASQAQVGNEAPYRATRPFPFFWDRAPAAADADSPVAALCHLAYSPGQGYHMVNTRMLRLPYYQESVITAYYFREGQNLARRLQSTYWQDRHLPRKLLGLSPFGPTAGPAAFCIQSDNGPLFCLPDRKPSSRAVLRLWPYRKGVILSGNAMEIDIAEKEKLPYPLMGFRSFPACALPQDALERWDGFLFALLDHDKDEPDHMEPLPLRDSPYAYDPAQRAMVNASGEPITGRQQFAPVYTRNSAFTVFRPGQARLALDALAQEAAEAFPIPERESIAVEDSFDVEVARSHL